MPNERDGSSHARQIEMTVRAELDEAIAEFDLVARDSHDYASAFNKLTVALGRWNDLILRRISGTNPDDPK